MNTMTRSHPFDVLGETLLRDPGTAVADVLSGRAALGIHQRAEPEDFFADLLAAPQWAAQRERLVAQLDKALLAWLRERLQWPIRRVSERGFRAYAAELSEALAIAARLPLRHTARDMIDEEPSWHNRLSGLRWPGEVDLLRQFDMVLIQHQPDSRFAARWFAACERAAWFGPFWQTELTTGALGLRKLPQPPESVPEAVVAAGLGRFTVLALKRGALAQKVAQAFSRKAGALQVLYPRHKDHWPQLWQDVLSGLGSKYRDEAGVVRDQFLPLVLQGATGNRRGPRAKGKKSPVPALPTKEERETLIAALRQVSGIDRALFAKVRAHMRRHWAYAEATGESHFAVRTMHNLSNRLLRLSPNSEMLQEVYRWALLAVEFEPDDAFAWGLWARVLAALGQQELSIAVRWETIRRFPTNPILRNELAQTLWKKGQHVLAENLLRQTIVDFPGEPVPRTILAELLCDTGDIDGAEETLQETRRRFRNDVPCRVALGFLLLQKKDPDSALEVYEEAKVISPRNEYVEILGTRLHSDADAFDQPISLFGKVDDISAMQEYFDNLTDDEQAAAMAIERDAPVDWEASGESGLMPSDTQTEDRSQNGEAIKDSASPAGAGDSGPDTPFTVSDLGSGESDILISSDFLRRLVDQAPLIQTFFSPSTDGGVELSEITRDAAFSESSELALVAADRAGLLEGPEGRALIDAWA
ncbi:MAG: hypothetical protein GVY13_07530, partial [Alphaproteobacteria bacterium]|nr:hypothetical protein [Alphaproteobacteria bacterium]